jgi:NAD(P)-dependent dehydrogenase (short-subunit alcohol dehydrogenase family)
MTVPMLMPNGPAAAIGMDISARAGVRTAVSACASGTEAIANAFNRIRNGEVDVVVAGGSEAAIHPLPIAAFAAMQALSKRNDAPEKASRPYDIDRDGFVMGEGGGALVLESEEHALARGAKIYAEVVGASVTSDAYHITAPDPEGSAAARAMISAIEQSGSTISDVVHINANGAYNCLFALLPTMRKQKDGVIFNISSVAGKRALALGGVAYSASKFAMTALGTCVSNEVNKEGIRVINVYPGEVNTPILDHRPTPVSDEHRQRILQPEDVAGVLTSLAALPPNVHVPEIVIKPLSQEWY